MIAMKQPLAREPAMVMEEEDLAPPETAAQTGTLGAPLPSGLPLDVAALLAG